MYHYVAKEYKNYSGFISLKKLHTTAIYSDVDSLVIMLKYGEKLNENAR